MTTPCHFTHNMVATYRGIQGPQGPIGATGYSMTGPSGQSFTGPTGESMTGPVGATGYSSTGPTGLLSNTDGVAKAWVRFDSTSGTSCVIAGSYNVSSVTYSGTGTFIVNFTSNLPNANYAVTTSVWNPGSANGIGGINGTPLVSACPVITTTAAGAALNYPYINFVFHGTT